MLQWGWLWGNYVREDVCGEDVFREGMFMGRESFERGVCGKGVFSRGCLWGGNL